MKAFFSIFWIALACVLLLFSINCFYGYFYPIKYSEEINYYSNLNQLNPSLVASVINVESGYKKDRESSKGALGLMQIMPSTGSWIADKLGEEFEESLLMNPEKNIKYGCYYISYLINYFDDTQLAICAYNAGMGNVTKWISNPEYFENGQLKKIPFKETEQYYQKILKNLRYYEKKY